MAGIIIVAVGAVNNNNITKEQSAQVGGVGALESVLATPLPSPLWFLLTRKRGWHQLISRSLPALTASGL